MPGSELIGGNYFGQYYVVRTTASQWDGAVVGSSRIQWRSQFSLQASIATVANNLVWGVRKSLQGGQISSSALIVQAAKQLAASISIASLGGLSNHISRHVASSLDTIGSLQKQLGKGIAGTISSVIGLVENLAALIRLTLHIRSVVQTLRERIIRFSIRER